MAEYPSFLGGGRCFEKYAVDTGYQTSAVGPHITEGVYRVDSAELLLPEWRICLFDQEFVRENYPAKYALFRAVHYIYCFTERAEQYIPLGYFLENTSWVHFGRFSGRRRTAF